MGDNLIAEGQFLTVFGDITLKYEDGKAIYQSYCDVWRFYSSKIAEIKAFVINAEVK
ncbi:MAG: hypothetical protein H7X88_02445 [Gloeobacteraceae cyanobacterium ES-bin-316]|nr:hypothetical protein [Ferruginibacter sp.]